MGSNLKLICVNATSTLTLTLGVNGPCLFNEDTLVQGIQDGDIIRVLNETWMNPD